MRRDDGATLVETAISIIIILTVIFGLVEFGRYITLTSTATNASREAARYAAGTGPGSGSGPRYGDCDGMRAAAKQFAVLQSPTDGQIFLDFDDGSGTPVATCNGVSELADPSVISTGDRIVARVDLAYDPIAPLVDVFLGSNTISVTTTRTINKG